MKKEQFSSRNSLYQDRSLPLEITDESSTVQLAAVARSLVTYHQFLPGGFPEITAQRKTIRRHGNPLDHRDPDGGHDSTIPRDCIDGAEIILLTLDMMGRILFVNRRGAQLLGGEENSLIGGTWVEKCIEPQDRERIGESLTAMISGENNQPIALENAILLGKEQRVIEWKLSVITDRLGRLSGIVCAGNDITARKMVEQAFAERAEKIKLFAYSIAHDLKNPAISLIGLTGILIKKYAHLFTEAGQMYCEKIHKTAGHIHLMAENISNYIAATEISLRFERVPLEELCLAIHDEFRNQLRKRRITLLTVNVAQSLCVDRLSLLRILRNLVDNALKYGGPGLSRIEISYYDNGENHVIAVRDDGIGFAEVQVADMFTAFRRNSGSADIDGTGLGLAIVKEITQRHGGTAWASSKIGQGVTICFSVLKSLATNDTEAEGEK